MKKIYLLLLLCSIFFNNRVLAQAVTSEGDPSYIMLGYNVSVGQIYQYDGIAGSENDGTVGCAAKITADMLKRYAGAKITALNIGWSNLDTPGECKIFVRKEINGEDLASSESVLAFGWNEIQLNTSIEIPENPQDIYIGYFVQVPANIKSIPIFYPKGIKGSCLLWREGELDANGNRVWTDMSSEYGSIAMQAKVTEPTDKFFNLIEVVGTNYYTMQVLDEESRFDFDIKNHGMNEVYNVIAHFEYEGKTYETECSLPYPLYPGCTGTVSGTMKALGSGKTVFKVTEIDGEANKLKGETVLDVMTMPRDVANKYKRTPIIEYFESENINISPKYYNEFFKPGYEGYEDDMILVKHHVGDDLSIGDDESLKLILDIVDNDSSLVTVPVMMLDRMNYVDMPVKFGYTPMFSILFPDFARPMYDFAIGMPTFAKVGIETSVDPATKKGSVIVNGNIEEGVLPDNENLYITTYLVKKELYSSMQQFLSQEEMDKYCDPETKMYIHHNVLSQALTPMLGEELDVHSGSFSRSFNFTLDKDEDVNNMYAVSFLTRGAKNKDRYNRYVLNSARKDLSDVNGIENVNSSDVNVSVHNGRIVVDGDYESFRVYDIAGTQVNNTELGNGIYVVKVITKNGIETSKIFIN